MSHRSRLRTVLVDVPDESFAAATSFWAAALGKTPAGPLESAQPYLRLDPSNEGVRVVMQRIDGSARFHLDIESDDVEAEVRRLVAAGATEVDRVEDWVVLRDPAGLFLCVVPADSDDFSTHATGWG
jgi:Glyoxalase-like domain